MPIRRLNAAALGAGAWGALVAVALLVGRGLVRRFPQMHISAAPVVGVWVPIHTSRTFVPIGVAVLVIALSRRATARLGWRTLVGLAALAAVGWLLALNHVDAVHGTDPLRDPLATRYEYVAGVPDVDQAGGLGEYLRTFTHRIGDYPTHVKGHPPGTVALLWLGKSAGLDPLTTALGLVLGGWAMAVAAGMVALREVAGETAARRAAPFLVLIPGAIWAGTSMDAFIAGVTVTGIALVVAATGRRGRTSDGLALAGGLGLGLALLLSYGTVPALLIPVAVAVLRRRFRPLLFAGGAAVAVVLAMAAAGFWYLDGIHATRIQYHRGLANVRPYSYWVYGNLAALALATGPAAAAGLALAVARRGRRQVVLGLSAFAAVLVADGSGLSKGEVERIWLPFVPWLVGLAAVLPARRGGPDRLWLAAQATVAIVVQVWLRSPW